MTRKRPPVRGEDPQKPGEPTARRHPDGPERRTPNAPEATGDERPDDDGRASDSRGR